ncbi:MAG TPA: Amuc_1098 family type IV pilus outer membrane protein [Chthoniobacteraceae bacterium]|nr:Amuc_1098 family type IV pilus outer membrane protein [Chthoniobacteraceae bacterium]
MKRAHTSASTFILTGAIASQLVTPWVQASSRSDYGGSAEVREEARRQEYIRSGTASIEAGDKAMRNKDYQAAFEQYRNAADRIPNAPNTSRLYNHAIHGVCEAGCLLAEQRIAEGRFGDADAILRKVVADYDPKCGRAITILKRMEDPDYYNKTIGPKFRARVEEVKQLFVEAHGFYDSGRYDLAYKRCEQILNLDPYNIAARKFEEQVNKKKEDYGIAGYNQARSFALWQVTKSWDRPVRKFNTIGPTYTEISRTDGGQTQAIQRKLNTIIIPKLEFREASIREAIDFLKQKSVQLDPETDPAKKGVNIVLRLDQGNGGGGGAAPAPVAPAAGVIPGLVDPVAPAGAAPAVIPAVDPNEARITIALNNVPLGEALRYVTNLAGLKFKVEQYAVSVVPLSTPIDTLVTKEWKVPPGFLSTSPSTGGAGDALLPPGGAAGGGAAATDATRGGSGIAKKLEARDYLTAAGINFPPGSSAIFLPSSSRLIVKNTQENLDSIDVIVDSIRESGPVQVEIESKFVEINQNNLKELSFDWLLGAANIPGSSKVFSSGGTSGTSPALLPGDFPFANPNGNPVGTQPVTSGLRNGNLAISQNAIDALLFGVAGTSAISPAIGALSGVFTDPQFQLVVRALNQRKGIDLLSAPRVTAKSGQKATIEIIREFRYPTEFEPPQIPQQVGGQGQGGGGGIGGVQIVQQQSFPVTPTTPTAFDTRNTGVTLEVEPQIGPDGYTIELSLVPQVVEFEGFINYGSPIQTTSTNPLTGVSTTSILTPNIINQPIFSTRKVQTNVTVFDGNTVVLGGLIREDVQHTEDKIPLLGDIPLIGRLFRSSVEQHLKRNLVIFVSARLINPAGEPVHPNEEDEEVVETLPVPEAPQAPIELPLMRK